MTKDMNRVRMPSFTVWKGLMPVKIRPPHAHGRKEFPAHADIIIRARVLVFPLKLKRCGVHAIAQPRRLRAVIKDVPEMRATPLALHLGTHHARSAIGLFSDICARDRGEEAGPATARLEFRV